MKILFKKWDFWYWIACIFYAWFQIEKMSSEPYTGFEFVGYFGVIVIGGLAALAIYAVLKAIQVCVTKIINKQDTLNYTVLLAIIIVAILAFVLVGKGLISF